MSTLDEVRLRRGRRARGRRPRSGRPALRVGVSDAGGRREPACDCDAARRAAACRSVSPTTGAACRRRWRRWRSAPTIYERHFVLAGDDGAHRPRGLEHAARVRRHRRRDGARPALALGDGVKACRPAERANRTASRRGLYAARPLAAGHDADGRTTSRSCARRRRWPPPTSRRLVGAALTAVPRRGRGISTTWTRKAPHEAAERTRSPPPRGAFRWCRPFRRRCATLGMPGAVVATDVNAYSPAVHVADRAYRVPLASDPNYIEDILEPVRGRAHLALRAHHRRRAAGLRRRASNRSSCAACSPRARR